MDKKWTKPDVNTNGPKRKFCYFYWAFLHCVTSVRESTILEEKNIKRKPQWIIYFFEKKKKKKRNAQALQIDFESSTTLTMVHEFSFLPNSAYLFHAIIVLL